MPERCCLTNLPTDDLNTAEIQHTVSQSELIEPLGLCSQLLLMDSKQTKGLYGSRCDLRGGFFATPVSTQLLAFTILALS